MADRQQHHNATLLVCDMLGLGQEFVLEDSNAAQLGKTLCELIATATVACRKSAWERAELCCSTARQVSMLAPEYRGRINLKLAEGIVSFYSAIPCVGQEQWKRAFECLYDATERLAFIAPIAAAAIWLSTARLYLEKDDAPQSLWALQKSSSLVQDQRGALAVRLQGLVDIEYQHALNCLNKSIT